MITEEDPDNMQIIIKQSHSDDHSSSNDFSCSTPHFDTQLYTNQNQHNTSLIEFEQNEKLADESLDISQSTIYHSYTPSSPIAQMENLLNNLRSNYKPQKSTANTQPFNQSFDFNDMAAKILPMTSQVFTSPARPANQPQDFHRKGDQLVLLETRLENETLRRQHCEKQIAELNEHLLEVQQQLTVANCLDKRRDLFVQV